jgi:integrase
VTLLSHPGPVVQFSMPRMVQNWMPITRLEDVCSLYSGQLQDGRLVFPADITKNRSERYAILPPELYLALDAYKGKTYLWERYPAELIAANKAKGYPTHRQKPEFTPNRLYLWVLQLLGYYQKGTGRDLSSHDFRQAAFTRAAVAFDVTPETMLRYYTATEKKKTSDDVLSGLAVDLLPKARWDEEE